MGQAGKALRQVLETYSISQSSLASALGVDRPVVFRWFHEQTDPTAETVANIVRVLQGIHPTAAKEFIQFYLVDLTPGEEMEQMIAPVGELPQSEEVSVSALSRLFQKKTNSYKYLFFISLLDILKRRQFDIYSPISFQEIIIEMLANAWYPHTYFKLSFGLQDKIANKLDLLNLESTDTQLIFQDPDKKNLRRRISEQSIDDIVSDLSRYVPFLLIRPFFEQELKSAKSGQKKRTNPGEDEQRIINFSESQFDTDKPLYRFDANLIKDCCAVILHPDWIYYLEKNYTIVYAWACWEWLKYMQQRNPNVPAVANKLFPPQERGSLSNQKSYWRLVLNHTNANCIYSGQALSSNKFALDHYLPWSFVAHDQLWNLIPTLSAVNSSKSNNLPNSEYFAEFVRLQHLGISISNKFMGSTKWSNQIESYLTDLKINDINELMNLSILLKAYESIFKPLISIARIQGFIEWKYRQ